MKKASDKKNKVSYYVGWGLAYGSFAGAMFGLLMPNDLLICFFMAIAIGAAISGIYGKITCKR